MAMTKKRDDTIIRIGDWNISVSGNMLFIHHADHPGDISVHAKDDHFKVQVHNDEATELRNWMRAAYADLGPKIGSR